MCIFDKIFTSFWYLTRKNVHKNKIDKSIDMHDLEFDM